MAFDDAYSALTDHEDDARWAFGTGFSDSLSSVPVDLLADIDISDFSAYCLMLGDDALILSHRLQEWVTRAPELEDELAIANIALDLLGQARLLLTRAGQALDRSEDDLAFGRAPGDFRNVRLAERADADFAELAGRLFLMVTWRLAVFDRLSASRDPMLAAIAAKGVKELTYHRDYAAQWVVRLGDGTPESHRRMSAAMTALLPLTGELFVPHPVESRLVPAGVAVDPAAVRTEFEGVLAQVLSAATLSGPVALGDAAPAGGRDGAHTAELSSILREMRSVAHAVPGGVW
ncbi:phenylacetate-CoA oxygenase subunit PaaI [Actinoplanes sp. OR16]|uniref:1,2-phenylacetyl-CoA epoxidase subunit PaaC n=1 Tax=Actinoplanes sp. OR16 TaxID=946334 RepID=UPI000F6BC85A|nr:1,2-phenylacetyl-CoA epoxidase subunit PaaC [Actinoplanes sp. OR16]BBH70507.1 phenylacetate-CoA oxygenase subunit PaaI [Actinoplanes sp. OR16]